MQREVEAGSRRFWIVVWVLTINFVIVGGLVLNYLDYRDDQARDRCMAIVAGRDDNRAMWDYALELNPDNPRADEFRAELERRLPRFRCTDDNVPVTIPPD